MQIAKNTLNLFSKGKLSKAETILRILDLFGDDQSLYSKALNEVAEQRDKADEASLEEDRQFLQNI